MRVLNLNNAQAEAVAVSAELLTLETLPITDLTYHELAKHPVVEKDILSQVHDNLNLLHDLQSRVSFVMREVRYVLKV